MRALRQTALILALVVLGVTAGAFITGAAPDANAFWPLGEGFRWTYFANTGERVEVVVKSAGTMKVDFGAGEVEVTEYVVGMSFDGTLVREDHLVVQGGGVYRVQTYQALDGVLTEYLPPLLVLPARIGVGDNWVHNGTVRMTERGSGRASAFAIRVRSRVVMSGTKLTGGSVRDAYRIKAEISYSLIDGAPALAGIVQMEFAEGIGPTRISQGGDFQSITMVLHDYAT